jgi:hypothetical protein
MMRRKGLAGDRIFTDGSTEYTVWTDIASEQ